MTFEKWEASLPIGTPPYAGKRLAWKASREEALREAANVMCGGCKTGHDLDHGDHSVYVSGSGTVSSGDCAAWPIRKLLAEVTDDV